MRATASLLLDVGGQGVLGLVLDERMAVCLDAHREIGTRESGDRVEQDPEELVAAARSLADEALARNDDRDAPVVTQAALAVQRGSVVCWDRHTGEALSPVLSWRDRRSLPRLESLGEKAEAIRRRTGLRFSPYAGAPKIAWCLSELPDVRAAAAQGRLACGPLGSFLLARLLDERPARVDPTLAQRTLLWSRERHDWDPWLLRQFGLNEQILPALVPSRSRYGTLGADGSAVPVNLMLGDQNCLPFMDARPDPDTLYVNLGTGAFVLRPMREPVDDPRFQCTLLDATGNGAWALEGSIHGAASALNWLEREHGVRLSHERWPELRRAVAHPPLFLNRIDGLGSPWWQPIAEAAFIDGDESQNDAPEALVLAVLESIAFLVRANVDAMAESLGRPERVVVCGGLSRSDALCGLIADVLLCRLHRPTLTEGTALGLWCRLLDRPLPGAYFESIGFSEHAALERRYRRWRKAIDGAEPAT